MAALGDSCPDFLFFEAVPRLFTLCMACSRHVQRKHPTLRGDFGTEVDGWPQGQWRLSFVRVVPCRPGSISSSEGKTSPNLGLGLGNRDVTA
jgi:hypothetical protein